MGKTLFCHIALSCAFWPKTVQNPSAASLHVNKCNAPARQKGAIKTQCSRASILTLVKPHPNMNVVEEPSKGRSTCFSKSTSDHGTTAALQEVQGSGRVPHIFFLGSLVHKLSELRRPTRDTPTYRAIPF